MRKFRLLALATFISLGSHSATAVPTNNKNWLHPYVGIEYNSIKVTKLPTTPQYYHGIVPNIGVNFGDYIGLEFGYLRTETQRKDFNFTYNGTNYNGSSKSNLSAFVYDLNGYLPFSQLSRSFTDKISLVGSVGVGDYRFTDTVTLAGIQPVKTKNSETKFRIGGGLQFKVHQHINLRAMVRYTDFKLADPETNHKGRGTWIGALGISIQY